MKTILFRFTLLSIIVFISISCSSSTETSTDFPDIDGFDATIGENTTMVPPHVTDAGLNSYDEENHIYRFDADVIADADISLNVGEIMLIEGLALRKITSVSESNGEIEVETEFAALNEAFENLDINWQQTIEFTPDILANSTLEYDGKEYRPNKISDDGTIEYKGTFGNFEIEARMTPHHSEVEMSLLVKYDLGNSSGAMLTHANVKGFEQETIIQIADHETREFSFNNLNMAGEIEMLFIFAGGVSNEQSFSPPQPAINIPFMVGPIPMRFRIGTIFVTEFGLGVNGTAQMKTTMTYDGDMGFQVTGAEFNPMATGGIQNPNSEPAEGTAAAFSGRVHGQYGVAIPDISLRIFGVPAVAYLRQEYYIGASYTFPTCTEMYGRYAVNTGLDVANPTGLSILDLSRNHNIADVITHDFESDGCSPNKINPFDHIFIPQKDFESIPQFPFKVEAG